MVLSLENHSSVFPGNASFLLTDKKPEGDPFWRHNYQTCLATVVPGNCLQWSLQLQWPQGQSRSSKTAWWLQFPLTLIAYAHCPVPAAVGFTYTLFPDQAEPFIRSTPSSKSSQISLDPCKYIFRRNVMVFTFTIQFHFAPFGFVYI